MEDVRRIDLPFDSSAPGVARAFVRTVLSDATAVDDLELIASELATNAVLHGNPPLEMCLEVDNEHITMSVTNTQGRDEPHLRMPDVEHPGGHGLRVVTALARSCGWSVHDERVRCWAVLQR